jgi:hypothetical protein
MGGPPGGFPGGGGPPGGGGFPGSGGFPGGGGPPAPVPLPPAPVVPGGRGDKLVGNPHSYSKETEIRRKNSSHNGNYTKGSISQMTS